MKQKWNDHHLLEGTHAFLSASQYHWLNWTDEILESRFCTRYSTEIGTAIHELASRRIINRRKLNENDIHLIEDVMDQNKIPAVAYNAEAILSNLIPFVNDAIGFHMDSEIILFYGIYCYGTTDAIIFDEKNKILRIHDLKTGVSPAHFEQLMIYAALFCLEYKHDPKTISFELRLYQTNEVSIYNPRAEEITDIMNNIIVKHKHLDRFTGRNV